ncbi:DUF4192 domain-containing protein [Corynebacterium lubricantis]|uniref:DUF4192 domain-containing protein n=1 Tax=Corynebacterium lubricantis TaxID=541095 RepID=UPI000368B209|nr:DUF4192 domain-containing protein [Corynebacterium lubricantis]
MDNREYEPTDNSLYGTGDLIAALPGILGFFPQESVIVIGFQAADDNDTNHHGVGRMELSHSRQLEIGPVMRADLSNVSKLAHALDVPFSQENDFFVALIVSRALESSLVREAIDVLYDLSDERKGPIINVCWSVSEIASGSPYRLEFGAEATHWRDIGYSVPRGWDGGVVSNVALSPSMRPLLDNGGLPALTREEALGYFASTQRNGGKFGNIEAVAQKAYLRADELLRALETDTSRAADAIISACEVITSAPVKALISLDDPPRLEETIARIDQLVAVATVLARSKLRDCLVAPALEQPGHFATVFLAIATNFSGVIRANALSLWAIIATKLGVSSMATAALLVVQDELSGHSLSDVLLRGLNMGDHAGLLQAVVNGSLLQRALIEVEQQAR